MPITCKGFQLSLTESQPPPPTACLCTGMINTFKSNLDSAVPPHTNLFTHRLQNQALLLPSSYSVFTLRDGQWRCIQGLEVRSVYVI